MTPTELNNKQEIQMAKREKLVIKYPVYVSEDCEGMERELEEVLERHGWEFRDSGCDLTTGIRDISFELKTKQKGEQR